VCAGNETECSCDRLRQIVEWVKAHVNSVLIAVESSTAGAKSASTKSNDDDEMEKGGKVCVTRATVHDLMMFV
jgi:hypothetical protein